MIGNKFCIGRVPWNKGKNTGKLSVESIRKRTLKQIKPIIMCDLSGKTIMEFESSKGVFEYFNINESGGLSDVLHGRRKTFQGYKWKFKIRAK